MGCGTQLTRQDVNLPGRQCGQGVKAMEREALYNAYRALRQLGGSSETRPTGQLPVAIRNLGPWTGSKEGDVDQLRLPYRILLNDQKFVVIHAHISPAPTRGHKDSRAARS